MTKNQLTKIIKQISRLKPETEKEFLILTRRLAGEFKAPPPEKSRLLSAYHSLLKNKKIKRSAVLEQLLTKRAVRTLSGVAVISVLTKPQSCPGQCVFCPAEKHMPKSYLANEPAVMRAIISGFNPFRQVQMRLKALKANGHKTEKIELIVMGGTWSAQPRQYQSWYIKRCLEALNGRPARTLALAQKQNQSAAHRCVGLTLETRPDFIDEKEIIRLRQFGCTRVELGLQHLSDEILKLNRRGHDSRRSAQAVRLLRDAGFKINFHLMLNLPGSTPAKDLAMFKKIYTDLQWLPDMIKIYPCVVHRDAELYQWWKEKKYRPYTDRQLLELLKKIKKITPEYVRITRLIRDIPQESIEAGNKITNLRQLIGEQAQREGWNCRCIRCREAGHQPESRQALKLKIRTYQSAGGREYFLSWETKDEKVLYAFLRLRLRDNLDNPRNFLPELNGAALVREVHTYGQVAALGETSDVQHSGLGQKLLAAAEKICRQEGAKKIAVIAGVGVRKYYEKSGYRLAGTYMTKTLAP